MSWKSLSEMFRSELSLIKRKRKALEDLFNSKKISKSTYDYISNDLSNAKKEIENRKKAFEEKIASRAKNLKNQIATLEMFLANLEMHYVVGEIQDQVYRHQSKAISLGLVTSKTELDTINEILTIESSKPDSGKKIITPKIKKLK